MQRNYRFFFTFVFTSTLLCLYVHAFCWVYIKKIMNEDEVSLWKAMAKTPASIVLLVYTFISVWFVGGLTVFHTYLISTNQVRNPFIFPSYQLLFFFFYLLVCVILSFVLFFVLFFFIFFAYTKISFNVFCSLPMRTSDTGTTDGTIPITKG